MNRKSKKDPRTKAELLVENSQLLARLNAAEQAMAAFRRCNDGIAVARPSSTELHAGQKIAENEREITIEFLRLVNESTNQQDLIAEAVGFFQRHSGCEAVGLRLQDGDDFPYFLSDSFSQDFLQTENSLCARDRAGEIILDEEGIPLLECMCGKVIRGRFDPDSPFFTANGSFWTNSTTEFLASTPAAGRQDRTRHRCQGAGYESVALIPLRSGEKRLGLIQLNDRRPGMFSPRKIAFWERIFGYLAIAIANFQAEEKLRESMEHLKLFIERAPAALAMFDRDMRYLYVSHRWQSDYGLGDRVLTGLSHYEIFPEIPEEWKEAHRRGLAGEVVQKEEDSFLRADGTVQWLRWQIRPWFGPTGEVRGIVIFTEDITARKQAETALNDAMSRMGRERDIRQAIMDVATNMHLVYFDRDFNFLCVNETYARTCGYRPEEMIGKNHFVLYPHIENEAIFRRVRDTGESVVYHDKPFTFPDQPERGVTYWDWLLSPVKDPSGQVSGLVFSLFETTERIKAENAMRQKSQDLDAARIKAENDKRLLWDMMSALPIGVAITNVAGGTILANTNFEQIWSGPRPVAHSVTDYVHYKAWWPETGKTVAPEEWASALALRTGEPVTGQMFRIQRFDGSEAFVLNSASPVRDVGGEIVGCAVAIQDITELKQTEEKLKASLREKEVLLKEIHHRVKNNLQVISSLVDLQADALDDPALSSLFQDVRDRVRSMALVHEKLYSSENLIKVDFAEYVSGLMDYLWRAHDSLMDNVQLFLDLQPLSLAVEMAVPCGLLLNELVVNSLKHAFVGRKAGEITVALRVVPEDHICLSVRDNGIGMPGDCVDWQMKGSLGLKLVQMLTKQLKGTVEVASSGGTEFRITFPNRAKGQKG